MGKIYVGDIGGAVILNCGTDISAADPVKILYKKPSGTTGEWTGAVYNTNYIKYTTQENDIDEAGIWEFQSYLTLSGWTGRGETAKQEVHAVFM